MFCRNDQVRLDEKKLQIISSDLLPVFLEQAPKCVAVFVDVANRRI
jgi:hypothetical protein